MRDNSLIDLMLLTACEITPRDLVSCQHEKYGAIIRACANLKEDIVITKVYDFQNTDCVVKVT